MKIINQNIRILLLGISLLGMLACTDQLDELNVDPNRIIFLDDNALFTKSVRSLFQTTTDRSSYKFSGQYAHAIVAGAEIRLPDQYTDGFDADYRSTYRSWFGGIIKHANDVLQTTSQGETTEPVRYAMADIIAVVGYAKISDAYGDIPYHDGGKGKTEGILLPTYDRQEDIYKDLIQRLADDIATLKNAKEDEGYVDTDLIFKNDHAKWVRFANSTRLKLAMRCRFADEAYSRSIVEECLQEPLLENFGDNISLIDEESLGNPFFNLTHEHPGLRASAFLVDMLKDQSDPRLEVYIDTSQNGERAGFLNGYNDIAFGTVDYNNTSTLGLAIIARDAKMYIMTTAEIWFLRAEIALVYDQDVQKANGYFRSGIETSLNQWEIGEENIAAFMDSPVATLSGSTANMERQIGEQHYLALIPNFFEAWCQIRRTGYPVIARRTAPHLEQGVTDGVLPKRFLYPLFEFVANEANVLKAIEQQGPNLIDTPVWWDQK